MDIKDTITNEVRDLRRARAELRVQAHLAKEEAKDTWERLEKRWPDVEQKLEQLERQGKSAAGDLMKSIQDMLAELKDGYRRLRST
jgi:hypothetical protein